VDLNTSHKYAILACDGLWDVINHQQAAELVHRCFLEGQTPQQVAKTLVKTALQRKTEDNVTVVVVKILWEGVQDEVRNGQDESPPTTDSTESEESGDEGENNNNNNNNNNNISNNNSSNNNSSNNTPVAANSTTNNTNTTEPTNTSTAHVGTETPTPTASTPTASTPTQEGGASSI